MMGDSVDADINPGVNMRERFFDSQDYPPQNPFESPSPGNYYPYQSGYELEQEPSDYGYGHGHGHGQATFHQHVYSTLGGHGGGGSGGGGHGHGHGHGHKSKGSGVAISGLTLLAFLFFIHILQSCLKDQMVSMNPTVMVMTAGTSRYRKTGTKNSATDTGNKELIQSEQNDNEPITSPVADNVDLLTNDDGDVFYGIAPKISLKLDDTFQARYADLALKRNGNST